MKLTAKTEFSTPEARKRFVEFLSTTIEGRKGNGEFEPYKPNEHDDTFWTLDSGNNWKIKFFRETPDVFELIYRYQCKENSYEEALAGWLKVRIGASVVP